MRVHAGLFVRFEIDSSRHLKRINACAIRTATDKRQSQQASSLNLPACVCRLDIPQSASPINHIPVLQLHYTVSLQIVRGTVQRVAIVDSRQHYIRSPTRAFDPIHTVTLPTTRYEFSRLLLFGQLGYQFRQHEAPSAAARGGAR